MMEPVPSMEKRYQIRPGDVDFQKKLKLSALFNYFQDVANLHVESLGIGIERLIQDFGVTWVLTRIRVDMERMPLLGEEIVVETWPQLPKRMEFDRDFLVRDASNHVLVRATSNWVIMDIRTREVKKPETIPIHYPFTPRERTIDCRLGRFKAFGTPEIAYDKVIGYSEIDLNEHLNNSRYIDIVMDCFSLEEHRQFSFKSLEISYLNESLPGDRLTLYRDATALRDGLFYIEGINQNANRSFKALVSVRPISQP